MKTKTLEEARASAGDPSTLYGFVCDSIEPHITMIDAGAFYASAAISLRRIANAQELLALAALQDHAEKDRQMAEWAKRHGFGDLWPGGAK